MKTSNNKAVESWPILLTLTLRTIPLKHNVQGGLCNLPSRPLRNTVIVCLFLLLAVPRIAWTGENFFQIIYDISTPTDRAFIADYGYSVFVSYDGKKMLFDTGVSPKTLAQNLKAAKISVDDLDFVVLSHRHGDHVGGLAHLRRERPALPVYAPPDDWIDYPDLTRVTGHQKVSSKIVIVHTHNKFGTLRITDVLSLLILTKKGPYVLTGNSHTGITTILEKAKRLAGQSVYFLLGGLTTKEHIDEHLLTEVMKIREQKIARVSPSHSNANENDQALLKKALGAAFVPSRLGEIVPLD
jgi:7,8-dihydropterin-6-yl-methyl-4-(beta-D-ribofuranosyl)aminobenzene 5'-phosphate synthase